MSDWNVALVDSPSDFTVDLAALIGRPIALGAVVVDEGSLGQVHALSGADIALGVVGVGTPTATSTIEYTTSLEIGFEPDLSSAREAEFSVDVDAGFTSEFDTGSYTVLTGNDVEIGVPVVGTPTLVEIHNLIGNGIDLGALVLEDPTFAQVHALTVGDVELGAVLVDNSALVGDVSEEARGRRRVRMVASFPKGRM